MSGTTLTDVFALIDQLSCETTAEKALMDFKSALTELANTDRIRGAAISIKFAYQGRLSELEVNTRIEMPLRRAVKQKT